MLKNEFISDLSNRKSILNRDLILYCSLGRAKIVQRFPSENHKQERRNSEEEESGEDEIGFDSNIHAFCQPHKGWRLYARQEPPTYFVSVLTDIKGQRRLAACLTFLEPFIESSSSSSSRHHQNGNGNGNGAKETFGSSASSDLSDSDDLPIVRVIKTDIYSVRMIAYLNLTI